MRVNASWPDNVAVYHFVKHLVSIKNTEPFFGLKWNGFYPCGNN